MHLHSTRFTKLAGYVIIQARLHDTTGCQTGLTIGCIVYTNIQPVNCQTRLTTGLTTGCIVYTAGCQAGCQTGCTTRFDNRLNEHWLFVQQVVC